MREVSDKEALNNPDRFADINARFFKVDMHAFRVAAALGSNQAASYLVLACGTGPDHRTTGWSAKAIEDRTSLKGTKAKEAIHQLADAGLLHIVRDGTRPLYELNVFQGEQPQEAWIPQSFIGTKENKGPLKFFRSQKNTSQLEMMLEIYSRTNMDISCGVDWRLPSNPRMLYEKRVIRVLSEYIVHGFRSDRWAGSDMDYGLLNSLVNARQVVVAPHIVEHDGSGAEIITPIGRGWNCLDWENKIGFAYQNAGDAMLQRLEFEQKANELIVPFSRFLPDIEVVGIVRPYLLPATAPTLKWSMNRAEWIAGADRCNELAQSFTF
ncbi:hypothetical protein EDE05_102445 [Neorhizobium sp. R1-B]|nr:hypothetical protein EDE05_102445 [Neorhizobium sp. R1-B]